MSSTTIFFFIRSDIVRDLPLTTIHILFTAATYRQTLTRP
nr:MAG TPA: hypothetical protein [Caudoviricetes sp.]